MILIVLTQIVDEEFKSNNMNKNKYEVKKKRQHG
jgi:hypothetical protein